MDRSPHDHLIWRKSDGYSQDLYDSDTEGGAKRIAEREEAARSPAVVTAEWQRWIDARIRAALKPIRAALAAGENDKRLIPVVSIINAAGKALGKARKETNATIAERDQRIAALEQRIEALESAAGRGEVRGLYDPRTVYSKLDYVSHDGGMWIAKVDDPGALPGPNWMLAARQGKPGKPGGRNAT
jgi:hypothetical protein